MIHDSWSNTLNIRYSPFDLKGFPQSICFTNKNLTFTPSHYKTGIASRRPVMCPANFLPRLALLPEAHLKASCGWRAGPVALQSPGLYSPQVNSEV